MYVVLICLLCVWNAGAYSSGDSGGPLIQYNAAGEPVLVGVTSFGSQFCEGPDKPGVYVRPGIYESWLDEQGVEYTKTTSTDPIFFRHGGLSVGAIIGIAIAGVVLVVILVCFIAVYFIHRQRGREAAEPDSTVTVDVNGQAQSTALMYSQDRPAATYTPPDTSLLPRPEMQEMQTLQSAHQISIQPQTGQPPFPTQERNSMPPQLQAEFPDQAHQQP